jgi:hypothetical protein
LYFVFAFALARYLTLYPATNRFGLSHKTLSSFKASKPYQINNLPVPFQAIPSAIIEIELKEKGPGASRGLSVHAERFAIQRYATAEVQH